jgi:nucleoid-associated protein YgaU
MSNRSIKISMLLWLTALFLAPSPLLAEQKEEETYSISLVQTAEVDKEIRLLDEKKVLTENYVVRKGDHIWQLFRERGLLEKRNLPVLLAVLKRLNTSLTNLDLIYPGDKIVIPLTISPVPGLGRKGPVTPIPLEALKDIKLENYVVKKGDTLVKVVKERYNVPQEKITDDYLELLARLNPEISDIDVIEPGQVVRLPVYTPEVVRLPIGPEGSFQPDEEALTGELTVLSHHLMQIFSLMGEEWVNTGEHFIPLKSGGQAKLKANAFPIVNLFNGNRVIVDLSNNLPDKMAQLITSSWKNYRVVHLGKAATLRNALDKILPACDYDKVYKRGEPLVMGGDIHLRMTADWIIKPSADEKGETILITLTEQHGAKTPPEIRDFLATLGIKVIDYPPTDEPTGEPEPAIEIMKASHEKPELIELVLNLTGRTYNRDVDIPIYEGQGTDYNLIVKANFLLYVDGRNCIVDFTGLGPDILSILRDHRYDVLSLAEESHPPVIVSKTLQFIGVQFDADPHAFMATPRDASKNISMTIPGIVFQDNQGRNVFASQLALPDEIAGFLTRKGYKILSLALS